MKRVFMVLCFVLLLATQAYADYFTYDYNYNGQADLFPHTISWSFNTPELLRSGDVLSVDAEDLLTSSTDFSCDIGSVGISWSLFQGVTHPSISTNFDPSPSGVKQSFGQNFPENSFLTPGLYYSLGDTGTMLITQNQSPVPEPTTMLLFGAGLVGLAGFGRKRFKK